jgi:hypothetical protein
MSLVNDIKNSAMEIGALMPDSILFGSLLLYLLTQNLAFGVFAIFIFENVLSHKLLSWFMLQVEGSAVSRPIESKCRAGYKMPQMAIDRIYDHNPYPSYGVFSIVSIAAYLGLSTHEFSNTMQQMDFNTTDQTQPNSNKWSMRSTVAYTLIGIFLALFIVLRLISCDGFREVLYASVMGLIVGMIFFKVNVSLFGAESINFLGLPYMVSKNEAGAPIYVCAPTKPQ